MLLGVPEGGYWREILNSDAAVYGGSGVGNLGGVEAQPVPWHGRPRTVNLTAPPLAVMLFRHEPDGGP
jgi:1,4-alpha-glucan branching enzyme